MSSDFRPYARSGVWCAFLIPSAVSVASSKLASHTDWSIVILSTCLALSSLIEAKRQRVYIDRWLNPSTDLTFVGVGFVAIAAIAQLFVLSLSPHETIVNSLSLFAYVFYLPKLYRSFPKSFTFGEGCLVLQSLVIFVARSPYILAAEADDVAR